MVTEGFIFYKLTDGMIVVAKLTPSAHRVIKISQNMNNLTSSFKTQNDSGMLFSMNNTIKTNKSTSNKLTISYFDSVLFRILRKTKKGKFLDFCINFVKKSLNIETIMKLSFNSNNIINMNNPDINHKHKLLALDYYSFSVREKSIIKDFKS